jgi:hypothetical protein
MVCMRWLLKLTNKFQGGNWHTRWTLEEGHTSQRSMFGRPTHQPPRKTYRLDMCCIRCFFVDCCMSRLRMDCMLKRLGWTHRILAHIRCKVMDTMTHRPHSPAVDRSDSTHTRCRSLR